MSDPPGKVLSSLTPGSDKRNSKLGSCAGMFFQLFDWNRRFNGKRLLPHKLLPAERPPKHGARGRKDERLPMAKLLLIANENRGGFPKVSASDAEEVLNKDKTPEKKKSKRSPSVVAKLMGLETMPSPEPLKGKKQPPRESTDETTEAAGVDKIVSNPSQSSANPPSGLDYTNAKPPRALICHKSDEPKITFFCKLPALSPRKAESALRSILSPSKSHNKLLSPIKSPLSTKRGARLLEAAAKILEPNMQPSARMRGLGVNSQVAARPLLGSNASHEDQKSGNTAARPPKKKTPMPIDSKKQQQQSVSLRIYSDQLKAQGKPKHDRRSVNVQDPNAACKFQAPLSSKRGPSQESLRRSGSTKEDSVSHVGHLAGQPRLMRSKSVREEPEHGKSVIGFNNEVRNVKEEKGKPESTRQKQSSNRLSQPRVGVRKRELGPCSSEENTLNVENQDPNVTPVANNGDGRKSLLADSTSSGNSSGILNYGKLFNSRKSGTSHESAKKTQKKGDSSVMKSFLRKKGAVTDSVTKSSPNSAAIKDSSQVPKACKVDELETCSSESQLSNNCSSLSFECIEEESLDDKSQQEVKSALVDSPGVLMEAHDDLFEISRKRAGSDALKWESSHTSSEAVSSSITCNTLAKTDGATVEVSVQSDLSVADHGDFASSSYAHLELPNHRRKKAVSYSGKSTAAILQELLMALNSAKRLTAVDDSEHHTSNNTECESSSKFTLYTQFGEDCEDSASSAAISSADLRRTPLASTRYAPCSDEWRHPSPVSILEFPCEDDSSTLSDSIEDAQDRRLLSKPSVRTHHEIVSKGHHTGLPICMPESKTCKEAFECEEQYVKDIVKAANLSPVDIYSAKLQLPCVLLEPAVFNHLEEQFYQQWEWGIRPEDNTYANCRSETDMHFTRSLYVEAGRQNRKLVFECVNEALNIHLGINEHHSRQSPSLSVCSLSEAYVPPRVCRQMQAWRGLACCMNIDDMVEQEMNTGTGKWVDFVDEVCDFAVEMECSIFRGLIDELVIDLSRRKPTMSCRRKEVIW